MIHRTITQQVFRSALPAIILGATLGIYGVTAQESPPAPPIPQPGLELALTVTAEIEPAISMGKTPQGVRRVIPISGGSFEGVGIKGVVMTGGEDWQVDRPDGVTELDARYWLKTDDGVIIRVFNRAIIALPAAEREKAARGEPVDRSQTYVRTAPIFEAPDGPYGWLNQAIFIGTLTMGTGPKPAVVLRFYKVI